jgi:Ran GTPase-activating protein (RanGAP) involved in mRNA processing and transport
MDLCKMVVGPPHITDLIESLRTNTFITHFLLGNNIIGPIGARSIADFVHDFPERINTWYLAGNCIDGKSLSLLVDAFTNSPAVTNIWLKRNPLGSNSASDLFRLITETPNLRTLDLDQTELGDTGVADLFSRLEDLDDTKSVALTNLYLNGNGIGPSAAHAIGQYLANEYCTITSIYMSNNPIGPKGFCRLASGLSTSHSLKRLSLLSTGLTDDGAALLFASLLHHPALTVLDVSQSFATQDLGQAYNYLTDTSAPGIAMFLSTCPTLEYLNIGSCAMTDKGINLILEEASHHLSLLQLNISSINQQGSDHDSIRHAQEHARLSKLVRLRVVNNVRDKHRDMTYAQWEKKEKRWVVSDELDVRKVDSVYRNRDMALARRGVKRLEKWWDEDDTTLEDIMKTAVGPVCTR